MSEFDKPRCVRIISDTIDSLDETLKDHHDVGDYKTHEDLLKAHAELEADKKAMVGLKEHLEQDCE